MLCRPFHKFFNVGELDETDEEGLDIGDGGYTVLEKLDGAPFAAFMLKGNVEFSSKTGINKKCAQIKKLVEAEGNERYVSFSAHCISKGLTPIFEYVGPKEKRVVQYNQERLVLTALREMSTGRYVSYEEMLKASGEHEIACVRNVPSKAATVAELKKELNRLDEKIEGYVLRLKNGQMYKIKSQFYLKSTVNSDLVVQDWKVFPF